MTELPYFVLIYLVIGIVFADAQHYRDNITPTAYLITFIIFATFYPILLITKFIYTVYMMHRIDDE